MSDLLLDLSGNPQAKKFIQSLGLPIPMPQKLRRSRAAWQERPLDDDSVLVGGSGELQALLADTLVAAGANPIVVGDEADLAVFRGPGEAYGRPPRLIAPGDAPDGERVDAMVFDATGIDEVDGLRALYDFFHPWLGRLNKCGRVVVLGRAPEHAKSASQAAAAAALEGFVRSVAKEVGRKGSTGQLVYVDHGAEARVAPVLRFLLSARSAFVTAQPLRVSNEVDGEEAPSTRPLEGKVALVTGAARGIGAATAALLAAEGAHVVVLDRPADDGPASRVAKEVGGSTLLVDITDEDAPTRIAGTLKERFGGVDIVIHNAGVTRDKTLARMKPGLWDMTLDINLGAVVRITEELLSSGTLRDGGRIICLSSVSGIAGNVGQTNYGASKAGIVGYVRHLAPTLADRGISVNAIAPGFIETRLTSAMPVAIREGARRLSALGQGGQPQDVGEALTFLSSPGARGITGAVLRVCGGALVGA